MIFAACLGFAIAAVISVLLWHLHRGLLSVSLCPMECRTMWLWRWLAFSSWVCSATADVVKLNRLFWLSLKCIKKVKIYITTLFSLKYIHNSYILTHLLNSCCKHQTAGVKCLLYYAYIWIWYRKRETCYKTKLRDMDT